MLFYRPVTGNEFWSAVGSLTLYGKGNIIGKLASASAPALAKDWKETNCLMFSKSASLKVTGGCAGVIIHQDYA